MGDLSPHFSTAEMRCKDCGRCVISSELLDGLEALRALAGQEIIVDDGYRCPEHNAAVGGVGGSEHTVGLAADIKIPGLTVQQMYDLAVQVPAFLNGGIGVYDSGFIHVDARDGKARWARVKGSYVGLNLLVKP